MIVNLTQRVTDYSNREALEILEQMGPFEYDDSVLIGEGAVREMRPIEILENKTRYFG